MSEKTQCKAVWKMKTKDKCVVMRKGCFTISYVKHLETNLL